MANPNEIPFDASPSSDGEIPTPQLRAGMSATIGKIVAARAKAQAAIRSAKPDSTGLVMDKGGGRQFRYPSLDAVYVAVMGALAENELVVTHLSLDDAGPDGVAILTILAHTSGEYFASYLSMPAQRTSQSRGSALTYAERYNTLAICGVAAGDPDEDTSERAWDGQGVAPGPAKAAPRTAPAPERRQAAPRAATPPPVPAPAPQSPPPPAPEIRPSFPATPPAEEIPRPAAPAIAFRSEALRGMSDKEQQTVEMFGPLFARTMSDAELRPLSNAASAAVGGLSASKAYLAWHQEALAQARAGFGGSASPGPAKTAGAAPRLSVVPNPSANDGRSRR